MAINVGFTLEESCLCCRFFSGKIIDKNNLSKELNTKSDILLIHGELDTIVPPSNLLDAKDFFKK